MIGLLALLVLAGAGMVYAAVELHRTACGNFVRSHARWQVSLQRVCDKSPSYAGCSDLGDNPLDLRWCKAIRHK